MCPGRDEALWFILGYRGTETVLLLLYLVT